MDLRTIALYQLAEKVELRVVHANREVFREEHNQPKTFFESLEEMPSKFFET